MTIERVIEEMNKLAVADGIGKIDIPICANGRLKTTLGRVTFYRDVCIPIKIEFSKKLLDFSPEEDIIQVIKHEYAHYYLLVETGIDHKHDSVFKAKCAEIGCTHDGPKNHVESTAKSKYEVWCEDCNVCIGTYSRRCKIIDNIKFCGCGRCGGGNLRVIQNYIIGQLKIM